MKLAAVKPAWTQRAWATFTTYPVSVGTVFAGRYRIDQVIGQGGMGAAGGMTSYAIGRLLPQKRLGQVRTVQRYGAPALLFAWLPLVGDALCVAAGWLRMNGLLALVFMAAGRLARYAAVAFVS